MTPRRKETRIPLEQPVRFYKIIALSFLGITLLLLGFIVFMSSKRATITIVTKDTPVDVTFTLPLSAAGGTFTTSTVTASGRFSPVGDTEVAGVAGGTMTVHNDSGTAQPLVATTRFLSDKEVLFRLTKSIVVPANGYIEAEVYADKEGKEGDIPAGRFTIPGLPAARQAEVYGTTKESMQGGVRTLGILQESDIERASEVLSERILAEAKQQHSSVASSTIFFVTTELRSASEEVLAEVSKFDVTLNATLTAITYDASLIEKAAKEALFGRVTDDSETIEATKEGPEVRFEQWKDGQPILSVFYSGVARISPESAKLEKGVFFGKTRDEVRRYVLSLDHVHSVEIKFIPAWIQSVPHVAEHVNIVLKSTDMGSLTE